MKDWMVFERMTTVYGDEYDEFIDIVQAKTGKSAVDKVYSENKVKAGDVVPPYRRNKDKFWAKAMW